MLPHIRSNNLLNTNAEDILISLASPGAPIGFLYEPNDEAVDELYGSKEDAQSLIDMILTTPPIQNPTTSPILSNESTLFMHDM